MEDRHTMRTDLALSVIKYHNVETGTVKVLTQIAFSLAAIADSFETFVRIEQEKRMERQSQ